MSASNTAVRVTASPAQVRQWAESQGLIGKGQRGRLGANVIKAYNKSHGVKHTETAFLPTVKHTVKPAKGRKVTRTINVTQARVWARENGLTVGLRGTLPTSVLDAYVLSFKS